MLSALDDPRSVVEAFYRGGATAYMVKPVEAAELVTQLRNLGMITNNDT